MIDTPLHVIPIRTPSLGDTSYIAHDGTSAILIDPQRDIDRFLEIIDAEGLTPEAILETHVHNDYVSGGPALAELTGARIIVPAGAAPEYRHQPAFHYEEIAVGEMILTPVHTPGHTPEHTSYLVGIGPATEAAFTGGSLLVGAAGRSDLLGDARAPSLARLQYHSLHRLAGFDPSISVHPTHGPGSFCAASTGGADSSTIGIERATNPTLQIETEDEFVEHHLSGLPSYPSYYRHMAPINIGGAQRAVVDVPELTPSVAAQLRDRATFVDARPAADFAHAHVPGALWVGAGDSFASWVGWLVDIETPIVLITGDLDPTPLAVELSRIGYDRVIGHIDMKRWADDQRHVSSISTVTPGEWNASQPEQIVDVRDGYERSTPSIPGSVGIHVPDLAGSITDHVDAGLPVWVACASGYRSMVAGSILERIGLTPIVLVGGGASDIAGG